jgi:hypothetical protein
MQLLQIGRGLDRRLQVSANVAGESPIENLQQASDLCCAFRIRPMDVTLCERLPSPSVLGNRFWRIQGFQNGRRESDRLVPRSDLPNRKGPNNNGRRFGANLCPDLVPG